ncbi:MAG: PIG-L family deacetylase [Acidobacteriota bacterium]
MVIVSPHLDDAVFACANLLAAHPGSTVITVFAGCPSEDAPLPDWDARCGFQSPQEAVMARREEDRTALSILGARPVWLDFLDSQYNQSPMPQEVSRALLHALSDIDVKSVVLPIGLFHSDHLVVHDAAMSALCGLDVGDVNLHLYEDVPYRAIQGLLQQRLNMLVTQGVVATPSSLPSAQDPTIKARAVAAYASQLSGLGAKSLADLVRPERLWDLARPGTWKLGTRLALTGENEYAI